jgi:hypothetical protein
MNSFFLVSTGKKTFAGVTYPALGTTREAGCRILARSVRKSLP